MRRNGYLWIFGVYLHTAVRFADPDFLLECKILAIWRRFPLIFFSIFYAECPPYFYFRIVWRTDLESIPHASTPTSIIPARFKVDDHTLPSYSVFVCRHVTWPCDLDLEHMSCMASHVSNTATKYEDPTPIRSWVMSYNVWSWYDHTLPSYSVFFCWYITWLGDLDFWPWTVAMHGGSRDQPCYQVWRPYAYPFLSYEL